jgi:hypothetical protein
MTQAAEAQRSREPESPSDLPIAARALFFADPARQPLIVFSSGVRPADLSPKERWQQAEFDTTLVIRLTKALPTQQPVYHVQRLTHALPHDRWRRVRDHGDATLFLIGSAVLPTAPGDYVLSVVVQDEHSGRLGTLSQHLRVPDFSQPSTPSSLLLTRDMLPREADAAPEGAVTALDAGPFTFLPQPAHLFERGDTIRLLYHLYNPTAADLQASAGSMQIALLHDDRAVADVPAAGERFIDEDEGVIRFTVAIDTSSLDSGEYTVLAMLPNYQTRDIPHLAATFTVVESDR